MDKNPLLARGLEALAALSLRRPKRVLAAVAGLTLVSLAGSFLFLGLKTSNLDLVDDDLPEVKAFREFARQFGTPNGLVVVLEGDDGAALRGAADRLAPLLAAGPGVRSVVYRLPYDPEVLRIGGLEPYFLSRDGKMLFLFVQPDDPESQAATIAPFVAGVRKDLASAGLPGGGVRAGLTGLPQYALDDRDVVTLDVTRLSLLSFLLVSALFVVSFGSLWRPFFVMVAVLVTSAVLMGAAVLWPGHLTLLSSLFGSIVFGMGVDFGILIVDRVEEHVAEGLPVGAALGRALHALSPGLTTGSVTTAMGFFAMQATGFKGFGELGWLAGLGILLSLLAMATVVPALLALVPGRGRHRERPLGRRRVGPFLLALQRPWLALLLLAAAAVSLLLPGPRFDADYLDLEPRGSEAVRLEREMVARSDFSTQFAAFTVDTDAEAAALASRLAGEEVVGQVHSAAEFARLQGARVTDPAAAAALRARFFSPSGKRAVYAYPAEDVWDPAARDRFVGRMRSMGLPVTGMPFLGRFMIDLSHRALRIAALLAFLILVAVVWLDMRDPRSALLALLPTVLGLVLMRAVMALLHVDFNPLNIMALPVVIGVGEDNAVHLLHRLAEEGGDLGRALAGTGRSLLLTSGTTVASFVALSFASHRGLASFAQALAIGVSTTLAVSLLVLPQLARWTLPPARRAGS